MTQPVPVSFTVGTVANVALALAAQYVFAGDESPGFRSLAELAATKGKTRNEVAAAVGVDPLLLQRIDEGKQPLPQFLAVPIAANLGVNHNEVMNSVQMTTFLIDPLLLRPLPPTIDELISYRVPHTPGTGPSIDRANTRPTIIEERL